jgi:hypothetical protein
MEKDEISEFLKKMGMKNDQPEANQWEKIMQPCSSYLIVGDVGMGKSALAFWLLEKFSQDYNLQPAVVGFPREKKMLLPENFFVLDTPKELTQMEKTICFIDEADLQLPIEDTKAREYVVNFLSLPRHRKQIFLLAFHFPRLVMGRYLPFFSAFLLKRPPYLLEFASKSRGDALYQMMTKAEERFSELPSSDVVKHTYVVAPRIRWQGMLENPLCSFWMKEVDEDGKSVLSTIWAGAGVKSEQEKKQKDLFQYYDPHRLVGTDGKTPITEEMRKRAILLEKIDMNPPNRVFIDPFTNTKWVE